MRNKGMMQGVEIKRMFKIDAGHASYVTKPDQVAADIAQVAEK